MLSVSGVSPSTFTGSRIRATACMAPNTAAAPAMSVFMVSMAEAGLMLNPPESKVIPLPTNTANARARSGSCQTSSRRGGRSDPAATPSTPPKPPSASASRSWTTTLRPRAAPRSSTSRAMAAGGLSREGVLT